MVESGQALDSLRHKFLHEVNVRDDLGVVQATDDVYYDALQVVRVDEELLFRDVVSAPEQINLLTDLTGAAVINPFELAHGVH